MRRFGGVLVVLMGWLLSGAVALAAPGGQGQSPGAPEPNTPNPENPPAASWGSCRPMDTLIIRLVPPAARAARIWSTIGVR